MSNYDPPHPEKRNNLVANQKHHHGAKSIGQGREEQIK